MTAVDLDALEAALAAAKPGRWTSDGRIVFHRGASFMAPRKADAALIVTAVNALPDLIAALRRVEALHVSDGNPHAPECVECRAGCLYCEGEHPWPCPTLTALAGPS